MTRFRRWLIPILLGVNAILALGLLVGRQTPHVGFGLKKSLVRLDLTAPIAWENEAAFFGSTAGARNWIRLIDGAAADPRVAGMLLRINSPGGTIGASQELHAAVSRFQAKGKKVVVSVADLCASGAYYAAAPADLIVANPGSLVGSIGVILSAPEWSALMDRIGVKMNTVKSAPSKDMLSPWRPLQPSEREGLQTIIDEMYRQFLETVLSGRLPHYTNAGMAQVIRGVADGRVFAGSQAVTLGLVDKLGDEREAIRELQRLCHLPVSTPVRRLSKGRFPGLSALDDLSGSFRRLTGEGPAVEYRQQPWP